MTEAPEKNWVWRSTEESRATGKLSVLAVFETLVCVVVYWSLLLWFGVTWHHWMILIATPLVLLRSEQSIALGVRWFEEYSRPTDTPLHSVRGIVALLTASGAAGLFSNFFSEYWLPSGQSIELYLKALIIGMIIWNIVLLITKVINISIGSQIIISLVSTIFAAKSASNIDIITELIIFSGAFIYSMLSVIIPIPGIFLGIWVRAIITRFVATARYIVPGFAQFPSNWKCAMTITDIFQAPELIPGDIHWRYGNGISFSRYDSKGIPKSYNFLFLELTAIPIFFGPALLWRWSIKSTAWFYIPLLWAGRGWQTLEDDELQIWVKSYSSKLLNWAWLLMGGVSFAAVAVTLFSVQKWAELMKTLDASSAPITILGFLQSLDWAELLHQPWLWFYIPSYALTIVIFFALDDIAKDIRHGAAPETRTARMKQWMWAANARAVLTNLGLAVALWYFLDAVDACEKTRAFLAGLFVGGAPV